MQAVNMRTDVVVFDLENRFLVPVGRVVLPGQAPPVEVSLGGVARLRNAGLSQITLKVKAKEGLVTLRVGEALPVEPDLMDLIVIR